MTSIDSGVSTKSVVLVDDESDIVFIFTKALQLAGYTVLGFTDPDKAIEYLKSNMSTCGLVISDIRMPSMNGIAFATRVREISLAVPFVLMSAFEMTNLEVPPELRITAFLQKPIMSNEIKKVVAAYIPLEVK